MGDYTPKLAKVAAGSLEPGEELLAGARAMSKGATKAIVAGAAGAVAGGAAGALLGRPGPDEAAQRGQAQPGISEAPQVAVGLTPRRLLVWKRSGLSGKAKDLLGSIPVDGIETIEGSDSGSKIKPDVLTVRMRDGSQVEFEIVKTDGYEGIVREFRNLR